VGVGVVNVGEAWPEPQEKRTRDRKMSRGEVNQRIHFFMF